MKALYLIISSLFCLTFLLGCGAGGGPIDESDSDTSVEFQIPSNGLILTGGGIQSSADTDVFQTRTLSGGNSGSFTGLTAGVVLSGSYRYTGDPQISNGNLELIFNDTNAFSSATMDIALTFQTTNPLTGSYVSTNNRQANTDGEGETTIFTVIGITGIFTEVL